MKTRISKALASFFTALLVFGLAPVSAFAADPVCKIIHENLTETEYDTLSAALAMVGEKETIQLLDSFTYTTNIVVTGKSITFDVNGHTLNLIVTAGHALEVGAGGEVKLKDSVGGGALNVTMDGSSNGVYAHDGGKATVSSASMTLGGDYTRAVYATGAGSEITVLGNATGGFYGLGAYAGASITVHGNLSGGGAMTADGAGTTVTIYGNSSGGGTGVLAWHGATVYVKGNVIGGGAAVVANSGSQVTIDGYVRATSGDMIYIDIDGSGKTQKDYDPVSSKEGYFEYSHVVSGVSSNVWVKKFNPPLPVAINYIYEGSTECTDQNETHTAATMLHSGSYDATLATTPSPDPASSGERFVGWFTEPDGGGLEWVFGATNIGTLLDQVHGVNIVTRTLTLYAFFEEDLPDPTYTVTFAPGLHGTFTQQEATGLAAGDATPAPPTPTGEAGWVFDGWLPSLSTTVTGDVTYVAQWVEDTPPQATYTVTFAPGLHGTFSQQETTGLAAGSATPAAPTPTGEAGWGFDGWLPSLSATVTGNVAYVAQWTRSEPPQATYTVTFAPGLHGTFKSQVTSGLVAGSATPKAPTPTAETGWVFNGWQPSVSDTVTGDVIYVAQWTKSSTPPVIPATGDYGYQLLILLVGAGSLLLAGGLVKRTRRSKT